MACVGAATLTYPDDFPDKGIAQTLEDIPDGTVGDPTVLEIRSDDYDLIRFVNMRGKKHVTVRGIDGRPTVHVKTKGSGGNEVFLPAGCENSQNSKPLLRKHKVNLPLKVIFSF